MTRSFPKLSVCMIVKNEGHQLAEALESFRQFADEVVVVDTGSSDDTREVALKYTDRVFDFAWCNDFSAARNHSLARARGRYVLWMDADDRVDSQMARRIVDLKEMFDGRKAFYFVLQDMSSTGPSSSFHQMRCAPRMEKVRFQGKIHERLNIEGLVPCRTDVVVRHFGYVDPEIKREKAERNLELLNRELSSGCSDPYVHYYLSLTYEGLTRNDEAIQCMQKAQSHAEQQVAQCRVDSERQFAVRYLMEIHVHLARLFQRTRQEACALRHLSSARTLGPTDGRFQFRLGLLYEQLGRASDALQCFRDAMRSDSNPDIFPSPPLPGQEKILLHMAFNHLVLKDRSSAMASLREAWAAGLSPLKGWESLGFIALKAEGWVIALHAYESAALMGELSDAGYFFLGTMYKQRNLFQKAISCYRKALEVNPSHQRARSALIELNGAMAN
jgi:tetratricopeptide (TPR) repeat protein